PNRPSQSPVATCSAPTRSPPPGGALPTSGGWAASAGGPPPSATGGGAGARPGGVLPTGLVSPPSGGAGAVTDLLRFRQTGHGFVDVGRVLRVGRRVIVDAGDPRVAGSHQPRPDLIGVLARRHGQRQIVVHEGRAEVWLAELAFQPDRGLPRRSPCLRERRRRIGELLERLMRRRRLHVLHAIHQRLPPSKRSMALPEAICSISCRAGSTVTSSGPSSRSSPSTSVSCLAASVFALPVAVRIVSRIVSTRPSESGCR